MNHIKTIEIKNFKSIRNQKIEDCRRVNVFIGYPNVGKSNILEALGLYSTMILKLQLVRLNEICRVRHFSDLYFNRDTRDAVRVTLNNIIEAELIIDESNELQIRINRLGSSTNEISQKNIFSTGTNSRDFNLKVLSDTQQPDSYIDPVRKYEFKKDIAIDKNRPKALAVPFGNNLLEILQANGGLRKEIVEIFREYALKLVIETDEQFSLKFQKELTDGSAVSIGYHQIADTLQRLIFYKAAILSNQNSVLLFEEPEAHMFPPYIRQFTADVMFDKTNQFFIATHSPFVIDEFIEEIRDELAVYVVDYDKGETIIKRLTDDEVIEVAQYGIDLFFNLESYLDKHVQPHSA